MTMEILTGRWGAAFKLMHISLNNSLILRYTLSSIQTVHKEISSCLVNIKNETFDETMININQILELQSLTKQKLSYQTIIKK